MASPSHVRLLPHGTTIPAFSNDPGCLLEQDTRFGDNVFENIIEPSAHFS